MLLLILLIFLRHIAVPANLSRVNLWSAGSIATPSGRLGMIQCHGIGVFHSDEGWAVETHTYIRIPSFIHMTKVINLRAARKRVARLQAEQHAAERRTQYGMSKAERLVVESRGNKAERDLDDHRIENGEGR